MSIEKNILATIRDRLRWLVDKKANGNISQFAKSAGIPYSTFHEYINGRAPHTEHLIRIRENFDVNLDWLIYGQGEPFIKVACFGPMLGEQHGGYDMPQPDSREFDWVPMAEAHLNAGGGAFVLSERMKELYAFRKVWLRKVATGTKNVVLMMVEGDSMTPTISPGDVVMIDRGRSRLKSGLIYALGIDDTIIIKRLELMASGQICVISDNRAEYPLYEASLASIRILGQVIWFARQLVKDDQL